MSFGQNLLRSFLRCLILIACLQTLNEAKVLDLVTKDAEYFNVIEKLQAKLLPTYNKLVRPVVNHKDTVEVTVSFTLTAFHFDELLSRFSASGYLLTLWSDPRLTWSSAEFDGLETIRLPSSLVWKPDLEMYNSPGLISDDRSFANNDVLVFANGTVIFAPLCNLVSTCLSEPTLYPFDVTKCTAVLGSWVHNVKQVTMKIKDDKTKIDLSSLTSSKLLNWNLLDNSIALETTKYDCCVELYQSLQISYIIQRTMSTSTSILSATVAIMIMTLMAFFIPSTASGAKLIVSAINLMLLCGGLFYFHAVLPSGSLDKTPLIVSLYTVSLIPVIFSIITGIVSLRYTNSSKCSNSVRKCLNSRVGRVLGISQETGGIEKSDYQENTQLFAKKP